MPEGCCQFKDERDEGSPRAVAVYCRMTAIGAAGWAARSARAKVLLPIETAVAAMMSETVSASVAIELHRRGMPPGQRLSRLGPRETGIAGQLCHGGHPLRIVWLQDRGGCRRWFGRIWAVALRNKGDLVGYG